MGASGERISHGGDSIAVARQLGCRVEDLADMSSNLSPLGVADGVIEAVRARVDEIGFLPESGSEALRECFAGTYGLKLDQVLAGNGTTEFIFGAPASLRPSRAIIVSPTYGDYRVACSWAGIETETFALPAENDFNLDLDLLADRLRGGEMVFICNPNNPTGGWVDSEHLHRFVAAHPASRFLVDEAYLPFTGKKSLMELPLLKNLLILCSYSKMYCIPGIRLGFLVGTGESLEQLGKRLRPWGVNRIAQIAGEYLCHNSASYVETVCLFVQRERPKFVTALTTIPGVEVIPGCTNFILGRLHGTMRAGQLRNEMLQRRIVIRNCADFEGLDERYFRISLMDEATNGRCLEALGEILG
ncbi:MAG: aminotransferase class I/II-fold pyridoxal phosphate-dependent enzyme [Proteobacteria bacterium]|nr:aminotransferase class I/II-fold pyridoxal phosphate-dependent enzyme [Pseudomonadota bacterium]MBU1686748.1 aminotransferase class I/II-fold pyridoxal phosphate-dependent enzyme [Pseudomonadota bacterium]